MSAKAMKEAEAKLRRNTQKWGPTLMEAGWTALPSIILERQQALRLDALDVNILLQLARRWWHADNPPYPGKKEIAECVGVTVSTVRKRIAAMELDGLIQRVPRFDEKYGQQSNVYLFDGLIKAATPFAEEELERRKKLKKEETDRRRRKRPKLEVVRDRNR